MSQEEPEMGRFEPKGDPNQPREPFLPDEFPETPSIEQLHVPKPPLDIEKLRQFLLELEPIVGEIEQMKRAGQHAVAAHLQEVKNLIHAGDFSGEVARTFEKIVDHFNDLLTRSTPVDREAVLAKIKELETKL